MGFYKTETTYFILGPNYFFRKFSTSEFWPLFFKNFPTYELFADWSKSIEV